MALVLGLGAWVVTALPLAVLIGHCALAGE
jgi:hypothetical protein